MIKILIAHDHKLIRTGLKITLSDHSDMKITCEASDGLEALDLVKKNEVDTVILDISMPGMNGLVVSSLIRNIISNAASPDPKRSFGRSVCFKIFKIWSFRIWCIKKKSRKSLHWLSEKLPMGVIYLSPLLTEKNGSSQQKFLYKDFTLMEFQV